MTSLVSESNGKLQVLQARYLFRGPVPRNLSSTKLLRTTGTSHTMLLNCCAKGACSVDHDCSSNSQAADNWRGYLVHQPPFRTTLWAELCNTFIGGHAECFTELAADIPSSLCAVRIFVDRSKCTSSRGVLRYLRYSSSSSSIPYCTRYYSIIAAKCQRLRSRSVTTCVLYANCCCVLLLLLCHIYDR